MAKDVKLVDPLSEVTRKERRMLLGLSVLSVFIVKTGSVPTKVSALGIEFGNADQRTFLILLAAILFYFTLAFVAYALSDFIAWRKEIIQAQIEGMKAYWTADYRAGPDGPLEASIEYDEDQIHKQNQLLYSLAAPVSLGRAFFEFALPIVVGTAAFGVVVYSACVIT